MASTGLRRTILRAAPFGLMGLTLMAFAAQRTAESASIRVTDVPAPPGPIVGMLHLGSADTGTEVTWNAGLVLGEDAVVAPRSPLREDGCTRLIDGRWAGTHAWIVGPSGRGKVESQQPVRVVPRDGTAALEIGPRRTPDGTLWASLFRERDDGLYLLPGLADAIWQRPLPSPGDYDVSLDGPYPLSAPRALRVLPRPTGLQLPRSAQVGEEVTARWTSGAPGDRVVVSFVRQRTGEGVQCLVPDVGGFTLPTRWSATLPDGPVQVLVTRNAWSYVPDASGYIEVVSNASVSGVVRFTPRLEGDEAREGALADGAAGARGAAAGASTEDAASRAGRDAGGSAAGPVDVSEATSAIEEVVDRSDDDGLVTRRVRAGFSTDPAGFALRDAPTECLLFGDRSPLRGVLRDDDEAWATLPMDVGLLDFAGGLMAPLEDHRSPRYSASLPAADGDVLRLHTRGFDLDPVARPGPASELVLGALEPGEPLDVRFDRPADAAAKAVVLVGFDDRFRPVSVACPADRAVPGEWTGLIGSPWAEVWVLRWTHALRDGPPGTGPIAVTTVQRTRAAVDVQR